MLIELKHYHYNIQYSSYASNIFYIYQLNYAFVNKKGAILKDKIKSSRLTRA